MNLVPPRDSSSRERTLIDELLADQRSLTAVEQFAAAHQRDEVPAQAKFYRNLIPLTAPAPGEQYAFEVDLDRCSGCKACVTACHSLNGLDERETWRDVGLLFSADWRAPFQATVTTACHHCVDPGCLNGCPVLAYDKDPATGIVRHLDDQCIGCQYCVMKCPYDVPQYSPKRGIVRKCDMCSSRLSHGEAPACVQACPSEAIRITIVDQKETARQFKNPEVAGNQFLPASPAPSHTIPTTRYRSSRPLPDGLLAGDHARVAPATGHPPLVFLLVLTQLSAGAMAAARLVEPAKWLTFVAVVAGALGLGCGAFHLGQPLKAWRCFLGWRRSWFSREVIVFGAYMPLAALAAATYWIPQFAAWQRALTSIAALTGFLGVGCSAMIYADTQREFWRISQSLGKFFGTTLLLGTAAALILGACLDFNLAAAGPLAALVAFITIAKLAFEHRIFHHLVDEENAAPQQLNRTARLLAGKLGKQYRTRVLLGLIGGLALPLIVVLDGPLPKSAALGISLAIGAGCLVGELLERQLFFTAVAPDKMPGGPSA